MSPIPLPAFGLPQDVVNDMVYAMSPVPMFDILDVTPQQIINLEYHMRWLSVAFRKQVSPWV